MIGVAVFALSGALVAREKELDLFGGIVMAFVTAVGGGTFRDLVLDVPVFWIDDSNYILIAVGAAIAALLVVRSSKYHFPRRTLLVADAAGLALFAVLGTQKAMGQEVAIATAILMGILTGVGGGMIRDVMAQKVPLVLRSELYATVAAIGAGSYVILSFLPLPYLVQTILSIVIALVIRIGAIKWKWSLPVYPR
ncbi:MAG: trimeric intracellular cation channel family protein [Calditrichota bacterium]